MIRALFTGIANDTRYRFSGRMPYALGMPRSASRDWSELKRNYNLTSNKGNLFIGEGASRGLNVHRAFSAFVDVRFLVEKITDIDLLKAMYEENFDICVFAMANAIRPRQDHEAMVRFLEAVQPRFIVLGAGMQSKLPTSRDELSASTLRLLEIFNERAELFGVRGAETEAWLHAVGFNKAVALGCPSMYLYPHNIRNLRAPNLTDGSISLLATGYMVPGSKRAHTLFDVVENVNTDYIFQEEIFSPSSGTELPSSVLNDATGEVDPEFASQMITNMVGRAPPFRRYWYFQNPDAWRQACSRYDLYIGDRFHGGVASLQAGLPAIVLEKDLRVREMCEHFGIPNAALADVELQNMKWRQLAESKLSDKALAAFKSRYELQFKKYRNALSAAGIDLSHSAGDIDFSLDHDATDGF